jgi:hypothetical protein
MDLVMERMAKMTAATPQVSNDEDNEKVGMRLAAEFLNAPGQNLIEELAKQQPDARQAIYRGAVRTLLRNVVLPRDEVLKERSEKSLLGILDIARSLTISAITQIASELQQILQQYSQHKEQITKQLEDALLGQLKQQYAGRGVQPGKISAAMHPKYHEEMARMQQDLNGQYNQAMDQRKDLILQQLGLS